MSAEFGLSKEYLNWMSDFSSFDHDGVVADTRNLVTESFNKKFATSHSALEMREFNIVINWCLGLGLSLEDAKAENYRLWYTPESLIEADPVPGSIEFLYELHSRKKNFIINSSRIPELYESTIEWYKKHADFVRPEQIRIGIPDLADGGISKAYRILTENRRIHFEDVPEQARDVVTYTNAHVFLLSNSGPPYLKDMLRLTHITGDKGNMPDFRPIHDLFFG